MENCIKGIKNIEGKEEAVVESETINIIPTKECAEGLKDNAKSRGIKLVLDETPSEYCSSTTDELQEEVHMSLAQYALRFAQVEDNKVQQFECHADTKKEVFEAYLVGENVWLYLRGSNDLASNRCVLEIDTEAKKVGEIDINISFVITPAMYEDILSALTIKRRFNR